jgi:hypothetical protein
MDSPPDVRGDDSLTGDATTPGPAPRAQRGDRLLRAVVETLQAAGYAIDARQSIIVTSALRCHRGARRPLGPGSGSIVITHRPQRRCFQIDFLAATPGPVPRCERTLYWYYQAQCAADVSRIAQSLATTVCGQ